STRARSTGARSSSQEREFDEVPRRVLTSRDPLFHRNEVLHQGGSQPVPRDRRAATGALGRVVCLWLDGCCGIRDGDGAAENRPDPLRPGAARPADRRRHPIRPASADHGSSISAPCEKYIRRPLRSANRRNERFASAASAVKIAGACCSPPPNVPTQSPTNTSPVSSSTRQMWPGVWPGVASTRSGPTRSPSLT